MNEELNNYINSHFNNVLEMFKENGSISPFITVYGKVIEGDEEGKQKLFILDIKDYINNPKTKEDFVNFEIPKIGEAIIQEHNVEILCTTFNSESTMKTYNSDTKKIENKEDILFISISAKDYEQSNIYNIFNYTYHIDDSGELVKKELKKDELRLEYNEKLSGIFDKNYYDGLFANLYDKFNKL